MLIKGQIITSTWARHQPLSTKNTINQLSTIHPKIGEVDHLAGPIGMGIGTL
jgi:hypothetical protein